MSSAILFQRLEAAFLFLASVYFYNYFDYSFLWFVIVLFTIDLFMIGYLVNKHVGAHVYNFGHSLLTPLSLLILGTVYSNNTMLALGLIWVAHIGMDRMLGYGLKEEAGFAHTHLGRIGKK